MNDYTPNQNRAAARNSDAILRAFRQQPPAPKPEPRPARGLVEAIRSIARGITRDGRERTYGDE